MTVSQFALKRIPFRHPVAIMIAKRLGIGLAILWIISLLIFAGVEALPGDLAEAVLGQSALPETVAAFRKELKLDLPAHVRYVSWLGDVLHGDLGNSLASGKPITELIGWRFKNTLFLAGSTAAVAIPLALFLGMISALYRESWLDKTLSISTLSAISFPEFFVGYILITLFSVKMGLFPSISSISSEMSFLQKVHAIALPCLTLTLVVLAHMMRMTRAALINVMDLPFIEMARLKGMSRRRIVFYHALPNALAPIINVIAINLAYLVVGVVVVEVVFVYPGLGQLLVDSVSKRDLPLVQASGLIFAVTYVGLNLAADILSMISNPRLRHPN
ncbi:MAG: ABC transporter permease [Desulfobacterales bacterium]|nr:ABC transporter permease [Desulfobacterales bacterium]